MHLTLFQILALLADAPTDALGLLERLESTSPSDVPSLPALYRHIRRGTDSGWIEVAGLDEGDAGPGRPRQRFRLTEAGLRAARRRAGELQTFTSLALEGSGPSGP